MGQTLTNGVYLPDEGERNCYTGLAANWRALDAHLGDANIHVTYADKEAWNNHVADTVKHVTAEDKNKWDAVTSKADASALTAHTGNTTIHVTAEDKAAWNGKADASALTAHTGDTAIHVTAADKQAWDGHVADSVKHVTAADKAKWDAVTSKADDSDVVHKSGNETISGDKVFNTRLIKNIDVVLGTAPSTGKFSNIDIADNNKVSLLQIMGGVYGTGNSYARFFVQNKTADDGTGLSPTGTLRTCGLNISLPANSTSEGLGSITPRGNKTTDFGLFTYQWRNVWCEKLFLNGTQLDPSALSLPSDINSRIDISSYFTNTGTGQSNSYTVPANGYIYLTLSELTNVHCFSRSSGNVINYAQTFTKPNNSTGALYVLFPVRKNDVFVTTWYTTTTVSVDGAFFIPCKGNI